MKPNVVYVKFDNCKIYPYLNDKFDLAVGDKVYVDGKLAGKIGEVCEVLTKFKVNLKYYKYVLKKIDYDMEGSYKKLDNFVVGIGDNAVAFDKMLDWIKAPPSPDEEEDEFVYGDGYEIMFNNKDEDNSLDVNQFDLNEGACIAQHGGVKFICVINGQGKAAVMHNDDIDIIDFSFDREKLTDMYCTCISPKLCKNMIAVAYVINKIINTPEFEKATDFSIIEYNIFNDVTANTSPTIII